MVNENKIFSFKIKRQAKNVFPRDVERIVGRNVFMHKLINVCEENLYFIQQNGSSRLFAAFSYISYTMCFFVFEVPFYIICDNIVKYFRLYAC